MLHLGAVSSGATCFASARNSRVQPTGAAATLTWLVEKEEDRVGNNIFYSYSNYGNGEVLPARMEYTGFGSGIGDRRVEMVYGPRAASSSAYTYDADIASSYLAGGMTMQTQRLLRIDTYESAASKVASWKLDYQITSRHTGRSLLRGINQCATNNNAETCLAIPTQFVWEDVAPAYTFKELTFPGLPQSVWNLADARIGQEVLKEVQDEQIRALRAAGVVEPAGGFTPADLPVPNVQGTPLGAVLAFSTVADFDGDGARESLAQVQTTSGAKTYLVQLMPDRSVRSSIDVTGQMYVFPDSNNFEVADIDGDGRAEVLSYSNNLSFLAWNAAPGAPPGNPAFRTVTTTIPAGILNSTFRARVADFNGDGKPDLLTMSSGACPSNAIGVFIHLNNIPDGVVGSVAAFTQSSTPIVCFAPVAAGYTGESIERIADFDGDGLPDLFITNSSNGVASFSRIIRMTTNDTSLGTPISMSAASLGLTADEQSRSAKRVARWMDINGDGLDDFVFAQTEGSTIPTGTWTVRLNRGGGSLSAVINTQNGEGLQAVSAGNRSLRYANRLPQLDLDSDGRTDLLIPRSFAARMCSFVPTPVVLNGEGCAPASTTTTQCGTYMCPEDPVAGNNFPGFGQRRIYDETKVVMPMYNQGFGDLDSSTYNLDSLRFVQTGPSSVVVQRVPTAIAASLDRQSPEDTYGDGAPDLVTTAGCRFDKTGFESIPGHPFQNETPCLAITDPSLGPETLPNGQSVLALQNQYKTFINEGGEFADLLQISYNGLGDATTWRYNTLATPTPADWPGRGLPTFYSIPSANRYSDARHYYFTSTMPAVQVMTRSTAAIDKDDPTLAFGSRSFFYGYTEAMYNRTGRGFQGFRTITQLQLTGDTRALRSKTTFHQKFPMTGLVESMETSPQNRQTLPISRETNTWRCSRVDRSACPVLPSIPQTTVFAPFLDTQVTQGFDLAATQTYSSALVGVQTTVNAASSVATSSGWDSYGNLVSQLVTRSDGGTGGSFVSSHTTASTNNFTVDPSSWWIDKLNTSSITTNINYASGHALPASCPAGTCTPSRTVNSSYAWNADRTPQSQTLQSGVSNQQSTTAYGYSSPSYGLPTSITMTAPGASPALRATTINYSNDGISIAADGYFPLQTSNALLQSTTTERRRRDGQVSRVIAPTLLQTVTQFDAFGRSIQIDYKGTNGTTLEPSTYISLSRCTEASGAGTANPIPASCPSGYGEGAGEDLAVLRTTIVKDGQPTGVTWQDKLGRTVKQSSRSLAGPFSQTLTEYDPSGTVERQSMPHFEGGALYWATFGGYDHLSRPTTKIAPASEMDYANGEVMTTYAYTGTKTAIKVRGSNTSGDGACQPNVLCMDMERYYDSLGHLVKTVQNNGPTANYASSRYWFDAAGNAVVAQDAEGNVIRGYYDDLGRRTSMSDPDSGTWGFNYDAFGQMVGQTDARNVATTMVYDVLGRMTNRSSSNPGGAGLAAESVYDSWMFDPAGGPGQLDYAKRSINSVFSQVWKEQYGYNATTRRPETTSTTLAGEPATWVTSQTYDDQGREKVTTYPDGLAIQRNYHPASGIFNQLANPVTSQAYWTASTQDAFGNILTENYGNGVYTNDTSYASTGQMQFKRWYDSTGTLLDQFQYTYDSFGNVKQQNRAASALVATAVSENYTYDGLQRLTQASRVGVPGALPINTSYSPSGNLLKKSDNSLDITGAYLYGANGCGPHGVGNVQKAPGIYRTYGCDANGNVVTGNEINAVYDFMNLPRIVNRIGTPHPGSSQFRYDANGQRYEEVTGSGETTRFGPKGYEKVDSIYSRRPTYRHELGPVIVTRTNGVDDITYVGRDRMGSTVSTIPSVNPYKSQLRSYDPFGNPREGNFQDNGKTTEAGRLQLRPTTARGYTGHEHIDEGRVIHMNGRVYDYALGRFLGPDPIIQFPTSTQSLNPYSYIMNNPFAGTDPSGYTISTMDRVFARQRAASDAQNGCMGNNACNDARDSKFLQGDFRSSLSYGGAPPGRSPGNGAELSRLIKRGLMLADKIGTINAQESNPGTGADEDVRGDTFALNDNLLSRIKMSEVGNVRTIDFGAVSMAWHPQISNAAGTDYYKDIEEGWNTEVTGQHFTYKSSVKIVPIGQSSNLLRSRADILLVPCVQPCTVKGSAEPGGRLMTYTGQEYRDTPQHEFGHIIGFRLNRANGTHSMMGGDRPRSVTAGDLEILFNGYRKAQEAKK